jgi:hypothetical protein
MTTGELINLSNMSLKEETPADKKNSVMSL